MALVSQGSTPASELSAKAAARFQTPCFARKTDRQTVVTQTLVADRRFLRKGGRACRFQQQRMPFAPNDKI